MLTRQCTLKRLLTIVALIAFLGIAVAIVLRYANRSRRTFNVQRPTSNIELIEFARSAKIKTYQAVGEGTLYLCQRYNIL